jgi:hypothetical protein
MKPGCPAYPRSAEGPAGGSLCTVVGDSWLSPRTHIIGMRNAGHLTGTRRPGRHSSFKRSRRYDLEAHWMIHS